MLANTASVCRKRQDRALETGLLEIPAPPAERTPSIAEAFARRGSQAARSAFGIVAILLVGTIGSDTAFGQTPSNTQPPPTLAGTNKNRSIVPLSGSLDGLAKGVCSYSLDAKEIRILWNWQSTGPEPKQFSSQTESLSFWPTEVVAAGPGQVAVAGKRRARTILELWRFENVPAPMPMIDIQTGEYRYPELVVPVASKRVVFDEEAVGMDTIRHLYWIPTAPGGIDASFLVQFQDSRDVYQLDLASDDTTTAAMVASPTQQGSGILTISALTDGNYANRWGADHPTFGYCYAFVSDLQDPAEFSDPLILYDSDRDQLLDGFIMMTPARWQGPEGWADMDTYLALY